MTEELTTTIYFMWKSVLPDKRQYKQNGTVLELDDTRIAVIIPCTTEYIFNLDAITTAESNNKSDSPKPILTPAGMRYCIDELEKVMEEADLPIEKEPDWETEDKLNYEPDNTKFDEETDNIMSTTPVDDWAAGAEFDEEPDDTGKADNELWEDGEDNWK